MLGSGLDQGGPAVWVAVVVVIMVWEWRKLGLGNILKFCQSKHFTTSYGNLWFWWNCHYWTTIILELVCLLCTVILPCVVCASGLLTKARGTCRGRNGLLSSCQLTQQSDLSSLNTNVSSETSAFNISNFQFELSQPQLSDLKLMITVTVLFQNSDLKPLV